MNWARLNFAAHYAVEARGFGKIFISDLKILHSLHRSIVEFMASFLMRKQCEVFLVHSSASMGVITL